MEPKNAIIGDLTGLDLPQAKPDIVNLAEEKNMARYSKTSEFKRVQDHFNERIKFYQSYHPDGRDIRDGQIPTPEEWVIANTVIAEFRLVIDMYERASEAVEAAEMAK